MHSKLLIEVFKKTKENEKDSTGIEPSTSAAAKLISDYILEKKKIPFGPKSLTDYHRDSENKKEDNREVIIKQPKVVEAMCEYLGFANYVDFIKHNQGADTKQSSKLLCFIKKNKLAIIIFLVAISGIFIYYSVTKQRWMEWKIDHYVKVNFDSNKLSNGTLKLYKEERIELFKKISPICGETKFFNEDGSVKIWNGKDKNKELEYFTAFGLHPETGKTLKPITQYMIDKYICD